VEKPITYRFIKETEIDFLNEMLFEAIFVEEGKLPLSKSILKDPSIAKYTIDFGSQDLDIGIVAVCDHKPIGVIWGRLFSEKDSGYGFVDSNTPEIGMAVRPEFRNNGVGAELLHKIEEAYLKEGVNTLSLSVDQKNPAFRLYQRNGYHNYSEKDGAYTMFKNISGIDFKRTL